MLKNLLFWFESVVELFFKINYGLSVVLTYNHVKETILVNTGLNNLRAHGLAISSIVTVISAIFMLILCMAKLLILTKEIIKATIRL